MKKTALMLTSNLEPVDSPWLADIVRVTKGDRMEKWCSLDTYEDRERLAQDLPNMTIEYAYTPRQLDAREGLIKQGQWLTKDVPRKPTKSGKPRLVGEGHRKNAASLLKKARKKDPSIAKDVRRVAQFASPEKGPAAEYDLRSDAIKRGESISKDAPRGPATRSGKPRMIGKGIRSDAADLLKRTRKKDPAVAREVRRVAQFASPTNMEPPKPPKNEVEYDGVFAGDALQRGIKKVKAWKDKVTPGAHPAKQARARKKQLQKESWEPMNPDGSRPPKKGTQYRKRAPHERTTTVGRGDECERGTTIPKTGCSPETPPEPQSSRRGEDCEKHVTHAKTGCKPTDPRSVRGATKQTDEETRAVGGVVKDRPSRRDEKRNVARKEAREAAGVKKKSADKRAAKKAEKSKAKGERRKAFLEGSPHASKMEKTKKEKAKAAKKKSKSALKGHLTREQKKAE